MTNLETSTESGMSQEDYDATWQTIAETAKEEDDQAFADIFSQFADEPESTPAESAVAMTVGEDPFHPGYFAIFANGEVVEQFLKTREEAEANLPDWHEYYIENSDLQAAQAVQESEPEPEPVKKKFVPSTLFMYYLEEGGRVLGIGETPELAWNEVAPEDEGLKKKITPATRELVDYFFLHGMYPEQWKETFMSWRIIDNVAELRSKGQLATLDLQAAEEAEAEKKALALKNQKVCGVCNVTAVNKNSPTATCDNNEIRKVCKKCSLKLANEEKSAKYEAEQPFWLDDTRDRLDELIAEERAGTLLESEIPTGVHVDQLFEYCDRIFTFLGDKWTYENYAISGREVFDKLTSSFFELQSISYDKLSQALNFIEAVSWETSESYKLPEKYNALLGPQDHAIYKCAGCGATRTVADCTCTEEQLIDRGELYFETPGDIKPTFIAYENVGQTIWAATCFELNTLKEASDAFESYHDRPPTLGELKVARCSEELHCQVTTYGGDVDQWGENTWIIDGNGIARFAEQTKIDLEEENVSEPNRSEDRASADGDMATGSDGGDGDKQSDAPPEPGAEQSQPGAGERPNRSSLVKTEAGWIDPDTGEMVDPSLIYRKFGWSELPVLNNPTKEEVRAFEACVDQVLDLVLSYQDTVDRWTAANELRCKPLADRIKFYNEKLLEPMGRMLAPFRLPTYKSGDKIGQYSKKTMALPSGAIKFTGCNGGYFVHDSDLVKAHIESEGLEKYECIDAEKVTRYDYNKLLSCLNSGILENVPGTGKKEKDDLAKMEVISPAALAAAKNKKKEEVKNEQAE